MRFLPFIFSLTLFGSAFLSFSVQPILGKMLLPMVGGAPAGWIVAVAFFQLSLLAGYGVSFALGRISPWGHAAGLALLYLAGMYFLPPVIPVISSDLQGVALSIAVVKALFATIFVPFVALTATTAALQRVFAATRHETASDPYYLFVASNIGSFVGLFAYPFVLEPFVGVSYQTELWRNVYLAVMAAIILTSIIAWIYRRTSIDKVQTTTASSTVSFKDVMLWIALAFIPCSLSMGVTTLITTDLGGFPLFWVAPLGLYLLTFVLAFARKKIMPSKDLAFWHHVAVLICFLTIIISLQGFSWDQSPLVFFAGAIIHLGIFFTIAWACHQRLADLRPSLDRLPLFYFVLALGGALAGVLHAFVLPFVLNDVYEFVGVVVLSLLVNSEWSHKYKAIKFKNISDLDRLVFYVALVMLLIVIVAKKMNAFFPIGNIFIFVFTLSYMWLSLRTRYAFMLSAALFLVVHVFIINRNSIYQHRNFFGAIFVTQSETGKDEYSRLFSHGNTLHGMAVINGKGELTRQDFGYYLKDGPITDVLNVTKAKQLAVLGLGTGQLACFDQDVTTDFFEIDKDVLGMANNYFPYLKKCPPRHIYMGDGRVEIGHSKGGYDVILQDAFSSDGIPMHLLTHEAFEVYKAKLKPHGALLFHISNRYLNLTKPIAATANQIGFVAYERLHRPKKNNKYGMPSWWVVVPMDSKQGAAYERKGWRKIEPSATPWTDDRSSLLEAINPLF